MKKPTSTFQIASDVDQKQWDSHVTHPLQSWVWGDFRKNTGVSIVRLKEMQNGKCINGYQISFHPIPSTPWTIGYVPKSAMPSRAVCQKFLEIGRGQRAIFIQIEPNLEKTKRSSFPISNLYPSHHPLFTKYTYVLDLTKSEEELANDMHHKTRYNIRVAQKHSVVVREDNSDRAFDAYLQLSQETTKRQGFYAHNKTYHQNMWKFLRTAGIAHLWTASYQNEILASWVIFVFGKTLYYPYGASSRLHKEVMAPNLLLWEIVRWGKHHGYTAFDLWGALGPDPDPSDPWYGFHRFKEGYHPKLVEFIGSYDLVINKPLYFFYKVVDSIRWKILKFKSNV